MALRVTSEGRWSHCLGRGRGCVGTVGRRVTDRDRALDVAAVRWRDRSRGPKRQGTGSTASAKTKERAGAGGSGGTGHGSPTAAGVACDSPDNVSSHAGLRNSADCQEGPRPPAGGRWPVPGPWERSASL